MKAWIVVISIVVIAVLGSFLTNGYGFFKTAPAPAAPAAAPQVIDQAALQAAVQTELDRREMVAAAAAKKLAKAKADSIARVKAERAAKEIAALPAKIRKLEQQLATLQSPKVVAPADVQEINVAPALAKKAAVSATSASNMNAPVTKAKTFEFKLEVEGDQYVEKFGSTFNSWTEYKPGESVFLPPGVHGINAYAGKNVWAYDKQSLTMGKPNFVVFINGFALKTPGVDNGVGGANAMILVNPDGSVTQL